MLLDSQASLAFEPQMNLIVEIQRNFLTDKKQTILQNVNILKTYSSLAYFSLSDYLK